MLRTNIKSSNIKSYGYDPNSQILEVEFNNGGLFHYLNIDQKAVNEFENAESKGNYLHSCIKGKFVCKKVSPDKP